jgi:hypothetical protein
MSPWSASFPTEYQTILRSDLGYLAERCFHQLNPQAVLLTNWHIEVIAAKLAAERAGKIRRLRHWNRAHADDFHGSFVPLRRALSRGGDARLAYWRETGPADGHPSRRLRGCRVLSNVALLHRQAEAIGVAAASARKVARLAPSWARPCRAPVNSMSSGLIEG